MVKSVIQAKYCCSPFVFLQGADMGRIATQGILSDNDGQMGMVLPQFLEKPFGRIAFTVIFLRPILFEKWFRHQGDDRLAIGMDDGSPQHLMRCEGVFHTPSHRIFAEIPFRRAEWFHQIKISTIHDYAVSAILLGPVQRRICCLDKVRGGLGMDWS